ncbi:MAG: hypothetical protein M0R40_11435, partial [Firmicutes bacterium]|nr:hypothetical protein [Bacillota bacterium]
MKQINVKFNDNYRLEHVADNDLVIEQENVLKIKPVFPDLFCSVQESTVAGAVGIGLNDLDVFEMFASDAVPFDIGDPISGEYLPEGTIITDYIVTQNGIIYLVLSKTPTMNYSAMTATIGHRMLKSRYEVRAYLNAQNGNGNFFEMADESFTVPPELMVEGDLKVGFELKDGERYIRFEPFKITIKDFVRIGEPAGKFDYTVTISAGDVDTLPAGE